MALEETTDNTHTIHLRASRTEKNPATVLTCRTESGKKNALLLAGIKAIQEEHISISRVTITELLISSLGLLSGPFSHFINELSLGYLQGSSTHS